MRGPIAISIALVLCTSLRADDATDLRDKVLKAQAKEPSDLKKIKIHVVKASGENRSVRPNVPATYEQIGIWPGRFKTAWEFGTGETKISKTLCAIDDRGWQVATNLPPADMSIEELNDYRSDVYALWVGTLITLNDVASKLAAAAPMTVGEAKCVGLIVSRRPWPEVTLHFDEKTLLVKRMAYKTRDAGIVSAREFLYDAHKEFSGLMLPTKQTLLVQGKEFLSWTDLQYSFPDRIDPKAFAKPDR